MNFWTPSRAVRSPSRKRPRKQPQRLSCGWRGSWYMVLGGDLSEAGHHPCNSGLPGVSRRGRRRRRSACSPPCSAPPCHEDCGEAMQTIVIKAPPFGAWRFSRTPYRLRPNTPETVRQCRQKRCRPMVSPRKQRTTVPGLKAVVDGIIPIVPCLFEHSLLSLLQDFALVD